MRGQARCKRVSGRLRPISVKLVARAAFRFPNADNQP
jgi:hypothetical protein